jgi:hypothetical protein
MKDLTVKQNALMRDPICNSNSNSKNNNDNNTKIEYRTMDEITTNSRPALVFGASGEQGRAVLEAFVDAGYSPVYGFSSNHKTVQDQYLSDALQCIILDGALGNTEDVRKALMRTKAQTIFLTTTTEVPVVAGGGYYRSAQDEEYDCIVNFFETLKQVYQDDGLSRTVVFSTQENVEDLCRKHFEKTGDVLIEPLDDGSVVPHFTGTSCNRLMECS